MNPVLENALVIVLTPLATALGTLITVLIYKLIDYVSTNGKINKDNYYLQKVKDLAAESVALINQRVVDLLKKEGRFTKEKQEEAFNECKDRILNLITEEGKEVLTRLFGDYTVYIDGLVEKMVVDAKLQVK